MRLFIACIKRESEHLYQSVTILYSIYRIGLSLQLVSLSITVRTWSDFLSFSERTGRIANLITQRYPKSMII